METGNGKLLSVDEVSKTYNLSRYTIYTLIKTDSTFPCLNIGLKKNYRIPSQLLEAWLDQRIKERHYYGFNVPSAEQLFNTGRN